jgi:predicted nuclease of predicted toxin-antitoxin system
MNKESPIILLDVMVENLREFLEDKNWKVETVSKTLGVTQANRDDTKILLYAEKEGRVIITEDKKFIKRLRAKEMNVFTVEDFEKANIIHKKLGKEFS